MININIKKLDTNKSSGSSGEASSLSRFILPVSGEKQVMEKVPLVGYSENSSLYQHCDMCNDTHTHYQVKNAKGIYATCTKCGHGYKIS